MDHHRSASLEDIKWIPGHCFGTIS